MCVWIVPAERTRRVLRDGVELFEELGETSGVELGDISSGPSFVVEKL
jgi:hypothetical protein